MSLATAMSEELMTMEVDFETEVPDSPAILNEPTCLKLSDATDTGSGLICLPLEYEEKELEKSPLPREVVLTEGMDHHLLCCFPCTTLAFLPVVEEEFLVADLLRYTEGFPEPFFIGPVSECDWEVVTLLCPLETWTSTFTVCGVLLTSS